MDIWRGLKLVRSQSILFFSAALLAFIAIMIGPSFAADEVVIYRSSAKVLITPNSTPVSLAGERQTDTSVKTWFADEATLRILLSSQDLLDVVIDSTNVKASWSELRERIQLKILSNNGNQVSLLEIAVVGQKPEETRILTLTLADKFIQYVQQLSAAEHDKTVAFLDRERRNSEREVARAQKKLLSIGIIPRGSGRSDPSEEAWVQLQGRRSELERDDAMAQAEVEQMEVALESGMSMADTIGGAGVVNESVSKERLKLAEIQENFTDRSPQVVAQKEKLRRAEEIARSESTQMYSARLEGLRRKREKISALLHETESRLKKLEAARPSAEKHLEYANQDRQLTMWQENYLDLTRQLYRARVMQQSSRREGAFTIVEKAQPGVPIAGKVGGNSPLTRALIGIPLSLIIGLGAVMGYEYLTASLRLQPRIEEAMGLPIIGSIPNMPTDLVTEWDSMKSLVGKPMTKKDELALK